MRRLLLVVVATFVLLAGCKVDTTLTIDVHDNGGGSVRIRVALDADAVQNAQAGGGRLEDRVRLGDLQAAGWTVSPWRRARDGNIPCFSLGAWGGSPKLAAARGFG